ncbi:monocarboxylate transporter [Plakobranchus ocellatus]|uniref:Monocarboxylate transporter n=1 Tax=Plakobranchus ocellatus TaxID=259542 RepID=A0AAV3ZVN1_9GAST|nr:monocarboxylate transporter [Plakobranchus ocellatus]
MFSSSTVSKREESGSSTCGKLWSCLGDSFSENMEEMLNFSILKNKLYWFVLAGNFIVMLGFYVPFVYMKERAIDIGIDETRAAFLLSVIGLANVGGRALTGVLMQFWKINTVLVTSVALIIGSIPITVCPLLDSYIQLVFLALVFGLCTAAYLSLCSVLLCDLLGVHYLTNAFGYVILFRGVACLIGPPMAGAIIDSTGEFDNAFYLGGAMLFLGGLSHFLLYIIYLSPCRGWWTHRRGAEKRGKKSQGDVEECKTKMLENEEERGENTIENV